MSLLEESAPPSELQRREQVGADKRATLLAAAGFAFTLASILGMPGPDFFFMGAAPAIAILSGFPALLGVMVEKSRGGFARALLLLGTAALAVVGARYLGRAGTWRVVLAYFVPAALFAGAALILAAPRFRSRAT